MRRPHTAALLVAGVLTAALTIDPTPNPPAPHPQCPTGQTPPCPWADGRFTIDTDGRIHPTGRTTP